MLKAYLLGAAVFGALDLAARVHAATTQPATREAPDPNNLTTPVPPRHIVPYPWSPDNGDGTFRNPIIFADYSDPDVVRVGDDFYMTASSFSCFPGLPILHSKDLVNWTLIGHALQHYPAPFADTFASPQHGKGVWAPSIRHHNGEFYIYFGDPDFGVFMTKAKDPAGPWEPLHLVRAASGWIDTCPFWDDDGNAYLVHGFAKSRAGIKNLLHICRMAPDGRSLLDDGLPVFDGNTDPAHYTTIEGPKLYKRNGYYYILAPGGGVGAGYQLAFRSRNILGPYEHRIVMDRGTTPVNGPHQGGWVDTPDGKEDWFIHFQEVLPYGRVTHLNPLRWIEDWPVIGNDPDGDGRGEPVLAARKPAVGKAGPAAVPQTSDEFDGTTLGLQWQWWADWKPEWFSLQERPGFLRLRAVSVKPETSLYNRPNLLLQKFPADTFTVTTRLDLARLEEGDSAGLLLAGRTTSALVCRREGNKIVVVRTNSNAGDRRTLSDREEAHLEIEGTLLTLAMRVDAGGLCSLSAGAADGPLQTVGKPVKAVNAQWIGAKVGLFASAAPGASAAGNVDVDYFRFAP